MSYNGSGTFQINTSGQPVVAGTVISSTAFNALTADLATGLSTAITKDGQTATTVRIPFAQGISSTLTTDSSSVSTGSIITAGGAGIAKALYVGTTANVAGAVTLQSTLGVTGVATFSAAPIYSSLTASSAVATDASKGLVSVTNTGTGNNVLATSPTLVTPVLGVASATSITVAAGTVSDPAITTTGDTNTGIFFPAADTIAFAEGGAEAMRIDSSGNVGIGVTPSAWNTGKAIEVSSLGTALWSSSAGSASISAGAYFNSGWKYANATSKPSLIDIDNAGKISFLTATAAGTAGGAISFNTSMIVDNSGNLLLGVTSLSTSERFNCTKSAAGNKIAHFENTGNTNGDELLRTKLGSNADNTTSYHLVCSTVNDKLYIFGNGNVVNVNNSYGTLSDIKLKENVVDATPKLADVMQLKVRNFNLKTDPKHKQIGFIAQELEQVFPALIDETHDRAEDGSQLETTVKSIKTSVLLPILVKAIQEQQALITAQQASLDSLTARITALEAK